MEVAERRGNFAPLLNRSCVSDPNSTLECLIFCLPHLKEPLRGF